MAEGDFLRRRSQETVTEAFLDVIRAHEGQKKDLTWRQLVAAIVERGTPEDTAKKIVAEMIRFGLIYRVPPVRRNVDGRDAEMRPTVLGLKWLEWMNGEGVDEVPWPNPWAREEGDSAEFYEDA